MPTTQEFWDQMAAYNNATAPVQAVLVIAAAVLTYMVFTRPARAQSPMKAFLALASAWNGIVFFLVFAQSPISRTAEHPSSSSLRPRLPWTPSRAEPGLGHRRSRGNDTPRSSGCSWLSPTLLSGLYWGKGTQALSCRSLLAL